MMATEQLPKVPENTLKDRVGGVVLLVLSGFVFWVASDFPVSQSFDPGVAAWPQILAVGIAVCALVPLLKPRVVQEFPTGSRLVRVLLTIAVLIVYMLLLETIGFVFATTLYLVLQFLILGVTSVRVYLFIPIPLSVGLFYLFRNMLEVSLPLSGIGGLPL